MPTQRDAFLADMLPRQDAAERAMLNGDADVRRALWTRHDPVNLFGAAVPVRSGWADVDRTFGWVASRFSDLTDYRFELVAAEADGDLAYTIGFEHKTVRVHGEEKTYTLRATHIYRRENGEWKIVHRHGDYVPADQEA